MTDSDRQLLFEVRDLLRELLGAERIVDIQREMRMTQEQRKQRSRERVAAARESYRQAPRTFA